jgi:hypothetical protein
MDSERRIRTSLRLELETTASELSRLEKEIAKGNSKPEVLQQEKELREYYKKLEDQYNQVSGGQTPITSVSKKKRNIVSLILSLLGSSALVFGFYNLGMQTVTNYTPLGLWAGINGIGLIASDVVLASNLKYSALLLAIGFGVAGLCALGLGLSNLKSRGTLVESIGMLVMTVWMAYGSIGVLAGMITEWDSLYALKDGWLRIIVCFGTYAAALLISIILHKNILTKLLSFLQAGLVIGFCTLFYLQDLGRVFETWPILVGIMLVCSGLQFLKSFSYT